MEQEKTTTHPKAIQGKNKFSRRGFIRTTTLSTLAVAAGTSINSCSGGANRRG
jgi:hypothetical protein